MLTVEDILMVKGPDVVVADQGMSVFDAARLMAESDVGSLIVKDQGDVCGIFTERDLLKRVVARALDVKDTLLSDVMSSPALSCQLSTSVNDVADTMTSHRFRHLVVLEDGTLVGLIGLRDVLAAQLQEEGLKVHEFGRHV